MRNYTKKWWLECRGNPGSKAKVLKNLGKKLQHRLALTFSMFYKQHLYYFKAFKLQKSYSFWGLHPQIPTEILLLVSIGILDLRIEKMHYFCDLFVAAAEGSFNSLLRILLMIMLGLLYWQCFNSAFH